MSSAIWSLARPPMPTTATRTASLGAPNTLELALRAAAELMRKFLRSMDAPWLPNWLDGQLAVRGNYRSRYHVAGFPGDKGGQVAHGFLRSEERRVGKECRSR